MPGIRLERVTKVYDGDVLAVDDVSLEAADGEFIVLVGPSGCGKSTLLLRMIAGLEKVTAGGVWIGDDDVTMLDPPDRDLAMVFQSYALYPHKTVRENLAVLRPPPAQGRKAGDHRARRPHGCDARARRADGAKARGALGRPAPAGRDGAGAGAGREPSSWTSRSPTSTPSCGRACAAASPGF